MAKKNDRPLANEMVDGVGDQMSKADLGKRSPVTRAKRNRPAPAAANSLDPTAAAMAAIIARNSTDLRAKDSKGRPIPTLADRTRAEGAAAYHRPGSKKRAELEKRKKAHKRVNLKKGK